MASYSRYCVEVQVELEVRQLHEILDRRESVAERIGELPHLGGGERWILSMNRGGQARGHRDVELRRQRLYGGVARTRLPDGIDEVAQSAGRFGPYDEVECHLTQIAVGGYDREALVQLEIHELSQLVPGRERRQ